MVKRLLPILTLAVVLPACSEPPGLLPHSVYYLEGPPEQAQVWRLETDGATTTQLTREPVGVRAFAVSPTDGSLAFVSDNQLILVDGEGANRRLVADGASIDPRLEDYALRSHVEAPSFSPDGGTVAYGLDGLHLYDVESDADQHIIRDFEALPGDPYVFARQGYAPGPWSPDGKKLLVVMGYYEGSTLAVLDLEPKPEFRRLKTDGPVCCYFSWTQDSQSVMVANPSFTVVWPGLWRYDAGTGEGSGLVTTTPGESRFVGWPVQLATGEYLFFYGEEFSPDTGIPLVMTRSDPDGLHTVTVRPEVFQGEALWAPDGALALIAEFNEGSPSRLVLARPDGSPLQELLQGERIDQLAWGP